MIKKRKHKGIRKLKSANRNALESKSRSGKSDRLGENLYLFNTKIGENYLRFQKNISYIVRDLKGKFHRQSKKGRTNFDRFIENQNRLKQKRKQAQRPKSPLFQRLENFTNRVLGRVINKKLAPDKKPLKIKSKESQNILPQPQSLPSIDPKPKPKPRQLISLPLPPEPSPNLNQISLTQKQDLVTNTSNLILTPESQKKLNKEISKVKNINKVAEKYQIEGVFQLIYLLNTVKVFKKLTKYYKWLSKIKEIPQYNFFNSLYKENLDNLTQEIKKLTTSSEKQKKEFSEKVKKAQLELIGLKNKKFLDTIIDLDNQEFIKYYLNNKIDDNIINQIISKLEKGLENNIFIYKGETALDKSLFDFFNYTGYSVEEIKLFIYRFKVLKEIKLKDKKFLNKNLNPKLKIKYDETIEKLIYNLVVHKTKTEIPDLDSLQKNKLEEFESFKSSPDFKEIKKLFNLGDEEDQPDENTSLAIYLYYYFEELKEKSKNYNFKETVKDIPIDPSLPVDFIQSYMSKVFEVYGFFINQEREKEIAQGLNPSSYSYISQIRIEDIDKVIGSYQPKDKKYNISYQFITKKARKLYPNLSTEKGVEIILAKNIAHEMTHPLEYIDNQTGVMAMLYILKLIDEYGLFYHNQSLPLLNAFRRDYSGHISYLQKSQKNVITEFVSTTMDRLLPLYLESVETGDIREFSKTIKGKEEIIFAVLNILDYLKNQKEETKLTDLDNENKLKSVKEIDNKREINLVNFNNFSLKDKLSFFSDTQYFTTFKQGLTDNKGSIKKLKPFLESYGIEVTKNNKDLSVTIFNRVIKESTPAKLAKAISDYWDSDDLYFYTKSGENVNKFIQKNLFKKESQEETNLSYYLKPELAIRFVQNNKLNMTALVTMVGLSIKNKAIKEGYFLTENLIRKELDKLGYNSTLFKENLKDILPLRDDIKKIQLALLDLDNDEIKLLSYFLDPKNRTSIQSLTSIKTPEQWDSFQNIFYKIKMGLDNDLFIASPDQYFSEYKIKEYVKFAGAVIDFDYYNQINNPKANKDTLKVFKEVVNNYLKLANNFTSYDFADYQQNYLDILDEVSKFSQTKSYHELVKKFITNNNTISKDIPLDVINLTLYFYSVMNDLKEKSLTGDALLKSGNLSVNIKGDDSIKALVTERFRATLEYYGIFFDKIRSKEKLGDDYSKIPNITTINEVAKDGVSGYWRRGEDGIWIKSELLPDRLQRNVTHEMTHPVEVISKESVYTGVYGVLSNVDITKPLENNKHLPVSIKVTRPTYSTATYSLERAKDYFSTEILTTGMEEYLTLMLELNQSNNLKKLTKKVFETPDHLILNLAQIKKIKKHLGI